MSSGEEFPLCS